VSGNRGLIFGRLIFVSAAGFRPVKRRRVFHKLLCEFDRKHRDKFAVEQVFDL
jgi:hypothetical protein